MPKFFIAWMVFCAMIGMGTLVGMFYLINKAIEVFGA